MAENYTLREATRRDMAVIRPLHAASWLVTYPNDEHDVPYEWVKNRTDGWLTPKQLARSADYLQKVLDDPNQFYRVAESDNGVVGFVHAGTNEDQTKELEAIYTAPETFGSGLGAKLMRAALAWTDDIPITLKVATYNERAIRFYEKFGFKEVEGSNDTFAERIPIVTMKREGTNHEV